MEIHAVVTRRLRETATSLVDSGQTSVVSLSKMEFKVFRLLLPVPMITIYLSRHRGLSVIEQSVAERMAIWK